MNADLKIDRTQKKRRNISEEVAGFLLKELLFAGP
jgi:hypothetical protein